jgi:hypothetical protein
VGGQEMSSIFLSHSSIDKPFTSRLAFDLQAAGTRVWLDIADLLVGDSLPERIQQAIGKMKYFGVVLSQNSVKSRWVRREVSMALTREIKSNRVKILPFVIDDCEIPGFLEEKLYADFRAPERYEDELEKVIKRLNPRRNKIVRLATHIAHYPEMPDIQFYFINITNISKKPIEITHVYYEDIDNNHISVKQSARPLPVRLEVNQVWETCLAITRIPEKYRYKAFGMFKIRLSTHEFFSSKKANDIPQRGTVPGGHIEPRDV